MSSRQQIVEAALDRVRAGESVSLNTVATQVGLSKPGLMYHFPTKEALMLALVDYVLDCWERELERRLEGPLDQAGARDRLRAYLDWSLAGEIDQGDLAMLADVKLRPLLTAHWMERMRPWVETPEGLTAHQRTRLTAVRLIADGIWIGDALALGALDAEERHSIRALAYDILEKT